MSLNAADLLEHIIVPSLTALDMLSPRAERLLLGTAVQASGCNPFCTQGGIGLYQTTPDQHRSAWDHYLAFRPDLASRVRGLASQHQFLRDPDRELGTNLLYSTAIAWIVHLQCEERTSIAGNAA